MCRLSEQVFSIHFYFYIFGTFYFCQGIEENKKQENEPEGLCYERAQCQTQQGLLIELLIDLCEK